MLSAADLSFMQGVLGQTQTTACSILRKSSVSDGMGGQTDTWTTLASTTCRVAPDKSLDLEAAVQGRLQAESRWIIAFPAGTDVTAADRVTTLGSTYEVTGLLAPRTVELERKVQAVLVA